MRYINSTTDVTQTKESIVVLGFFDGVHKGHQKLFELAKSKAEANNLQVIALSFYPHPTWVVGNTPKLLIMSRAQKKHKIKALGVDVFIEYPFSKAFADILPETFFEEILIKQLLAKVVIVGENYCFGKDRSGDLAKMIALGEIYNVEICGLKTVKM
jgi:riboflavin kinase/FMN adenylyltransferase